MLIMSERCLTDLVCLVLNLLLYLVAHFKLSKQQEPTEGADVEHMMKIPYSSVMGSIVHDMVSLDPMFVYGIRVFSRL